MTDPTEAIRKAHAAFAAFPSATTLSALHLACKPSALGALLDRLDSAERDKAELLEKIGTAYGHLWNTNNEPMAPVPLRSIGEAAYEARKILRDTLTKEQRGDGIYRVQEALRASEQKEPK